MFCADASRCSHFRTLNPICIFSDVFVFLKVFAAVSFYWWGSSRIFEEKQTMIPFVVKRKREKTYATATKKTREMRKKRKEPRENRKNAGGVLLLQRILPLVFVILLLFFRLLFFSLSLSLSLSLSIDATTTATAQHSSRASRIVDDHYGCFKCKSSFDSFDFLVLLLSFNEMDIRIARTQRYRNHLKQSKWIN